MPLETGTYISDLVTSNPAASDGLNQADDHMRLIKSALKTTFQHTGQLTNSNNQIITVDGTASLPSHSFAAEPTLGLYRASAGAMAIAGTLYGAIPIGGLMDFAGATAPVGYLACDGQAVSRATYAALFAAIGTTWGAGDGSTTFNVPTMLDRFRRHRNVGSFAGAVGTLLAPQNVNHTHTLNVTSGNISADHQHTYSGTTGVDSPDHTHGTTLGVNNGAAGGSTFVGYSSYAVPGVGSTSSTNVVQSAGASVRHAHTFSGTTSGVTSNHTHNVSGTTSLGSADGTETRPYSATVLTCVRAL